MKLSITQIVLGALIIASLLIFTIWIQPEFTRIRIPGADSTITEIFPNPRHSASLSIWTISYLLLGLSVLGCGIVQLLKEIKRKR